MIEFQTVPSIEEIQEQTKDWPTKYYSSYEERVKLILERDFSKPYKIRMSPSAYF